MSTNRPPRNTSWRGDLTELEVASALTRAGHRVFRPLSTACRYDIASDNDDGTITRIQCKTSVLRDGHVVFRVYSVSGQQSNGKPYRGQVDSFGVHCEDTGQAYLVPFDRISEHRGMVCLRVAPPKNGQQARIRLAEEFVMGASTRSVLGTGASMP